MSSWGLLNKAYFTDAFQSGVMNTDAAREPGLEVFLEFFELFCIVAKDF